MKKTDGPLVSIVIPTYNRERSICWAVESVLQQSYSNWELIVVDDGSTDKTSEVLKKYDCLRYLFQVNSGVSAARNLGIKSCSGEYIAFLDSDDLWKTDKLKTQIDFLRAHKEFKVCQTDEIWIRNGKWVNPRNKHKKKSGLLFEASLPLCVISPSSVIIHRDVFSDIGLFDEELPACEDYDLWLRLTLLYQVHSIDEKLIIKEGGHADQLSARSGLDRFRIQALEKILKQEKLNPVQAEMVKSVMRKKIEIYAAGCKKRGRMDDFCVYERKLKLLDINR